MANMVDYLVYCIVLLAMASRMMSYFSSRFIYNKHGLQNMLIGMLPTSWILS